MSNSTPQGPGPQFGSAPDASPVDERAALAEAMRSEEAAVADDDGPIDITRNDGPELTADTDDIGAGSA